MGLVQIGLGCLNHPTATDMAFPKYFDQTSEHPYEYPMSNQDSLYTQLTFHYINGQSESFNLYAPIEDDGSQQTTQLEMRHLLKKDWWIVHLFDQTVFINVDNVVKMEMKPTMLQLQGEDVFSNAERVTALSRGH
jgi:hypothetical protein